MCETRDAPKDERPRRLTFNEVFDIMAVMMACRGTCDRLRTATIIRDSKDRLIASGYNGSLPGDPHCDDVGHQIVDGHCLRTNHGEENAILNCSDLEKIAGGTVTIVGTPCYNCARKLVSKKPARLRYIGEYENAQGQEFVETLCESHGVALEYITPDEVLAELERALEFQQGPGGLFRNLPKIRIKVGSRRMSAS
jgi:dCMP deaminase